MESTRESAGLFAGVVYPLNCAAISCAIPAFAKITSTFRLGHRRMTCRSGVRGTESHIDGTGPERTQAYVSPARRPAAGARHERCTSLVTGWDHADAGVEQGVHQLVFPSPGCLR
jgi:hypothetical protein